MNSTIMILMEMTSNQNTIHLKSFDDQNEVLMDMNTYIAGIYPSSFINVCFLSVFEQRLSFRML